jgi:hypothetical protein
MTFLTELQFARNGIALLENMTYSLIGDSIMATTKTPQKRVVPAPGRKLTAAKARQFVNKQFGKTFAKLAK